MKAKVGLSSPGIGSKELIPPAYVAWRTGTTALFVVSARQGIDSLESIPAMNRFLGSLNVYKFELCSYRFPSIEPRKIDVVSSAM
jgi:hypothetical protein